MAEPTEHEMDELTRRVLGYIREHSFCRMDDITKAFGYDALPSDGWLFKIIHKLEAKSLIGVKRIQPKYILYPI
jgi:hypothetical protein